MSKIRLTEAELNRLIKESVIRALNENCTDENVDDMANYIGGKMRSGLNSLWDKTKAKAGNIAGNVQQGVQNFGQNVVDTAKDVKSGIQQGYNNMQEYSQNKNNQRALQGYINTLLQLQKSGLLNNNLPFSKKSRQALDTLIKSLGSLSTTGFEGQATTAQGKKIDWYQNRGRGPVGQRANLRESEMGMTTYDDWSNYLGGKEPVFEFEDGLVYVDFDENNGTLCSGHVTNIGFHKDGEVEVPVEDGDFQSALEEVYSQLSCTHEPM